MALVCQTDSRIADLNRAWQAACNVDVTDWDTVNEFIIATFVLSDSVNPDSDFKLQWRRAGGTFADVGPGTEIRIGFGTVLVDGNPVGATSGCLSPVDTDVESEGDNLAHLDNVKNGDYGEIQWALGFGLGALEGQEYEIQLVSIDWTNQAILQTTITTAAGAAPQDISNAGNIASGFAAGVALLVLAITGVGDIASGEILGAPKLNQQVVAQGIESAEAAGSPTLTYEQFVEPGGIVSAEVHGTPKVNQNTTGAGAIASQEAFGTAQLDLDILPGAIGSEEALGDPQVTPGAVSLGPDGIVGGGAFGTAVLTLNIEPSGIVSLEALGTLTVQSVVKPSGVAGEEAFGILLLELNVEPGGVASEEAFGTATVQESGTPQSVQPTGIGSLEAFGTTFLSLEVKPSGIISQEAFGSPSLTLEVSPDGIVSEEAFGTHEVLIPGDQTVAPDAIPSAEVVGQPSVALEGETKSRIMRSSPGEGRIISLTDIIISSPSACSVRFVDDDDEDIIPPIYLTVCRPTFRKHFERPVRCSKGSSVRAVHDGPEDLSITIKGGES